MDGLQCTGDELTLTDCPHNGWGVHDCSHIEDAAVDCETSIVTTQGPGTSRHNNVDTFGSFCAILY